MTNLTLADVRAIVRGTQSDATAWPDAMIDGYIAQAIRFYSAHFPRRWRHELTLATGTQSYDLPNGHALQAVLSVEYPAGQEPPRYLTPVAEWSAAFQAGAAVYAVRGIGDDVTPEADSAAGRIVFAEPVSDGESAVIEYLAGHVAPAAGDDTAIVTVPAAHLEAITAYVEFATHLELETDEALTVANTSVVLSQLGEQARRAWNRYKEVMDRLAWLGSNPACVPLPAWTAIGM
jgi:hypothetical protein